MPPKRRRTIAAVSTLSTALDSLRAKIHSFADTADEEQLREVAQLINRLSISNNGPFRLLDLPYELLEYTAERCFTHEEAAPILPVNKVFNELFANSAWKSIEFDNMKADSCYVSQDVLMKNARRIRVLVLGLIEPDFSVSGYFHYATSIAFEIRDDMEKMFTLHLEQMKCLRRVTLAINDKSDSFINAAAKWVDDGQRSGHVQQIVIKTTYRPGNQQRTHILASLMDKIKFKKRIRLDCGSLQTFPASIVQFMPTTLTRLTIAQVNPRSCHGEINKQVFGTDPQSVFVHLRLLCVQVCCSNSNLYDFQSFVPERFPILSNFVLGVPKQCCNGNEDSPLVTIFSSKQWPSISSLRLIGDDTKVPDIGRLLFEAMPALRSCIFRYMYTIDVSSSLISCLGISELSLIATILETSHVLGRFACLVYLELKYMDIDSSYLKFIASCPRLVEIKLTDCDITNDAIAAVYNYPCNSVRKVVISKDNEDTFTDHIAYILPAFPNLRILDLTGIDREETRMSFILKCPAVKIIT